MLCLISSSLWALSRPQRLGTDSEARPWKGPGLFRISARVSTLGSVAASSPVFYPSRHLSSPLPYCLLWTLLTPWQSRWKCGLWGQTTQTNPFSTVYSVV